VTVAAAVAAAASGFLPWTVSGTVTRTGFGTARSARLLGFGDEPLAGAALAGWFLVPALAGVTALAVLLRRDRIGGAVAVVVGVAAVVAAAVVWRSPLATGVGVPLGALSGAGALGAGIGLIIRPRGPSGP
jgi:hypothetical protein